MYCVNCGACLSETARFCTSCGAQQTEPVVQPSGTPVHALSMKWFKFLIYFALFAGAVLNLWSGITSLAGLQYVGYGVNAVVIYEYYGMALRVCDVVNGILLILLAVFAVFTRFRLAQFRKDGPVCLNILYAAGLGLSLVYILTASLATGLHLFSADLVASVIASGVMIAVNSVYFSKRKSMFIN